MNQEADHTKRTTSAKREVVYSAFVELPEGVKRTDACSLEELSAAGHLALDRGDTRTAFQISHAIKVLYGVDLIWYRQAQIEEA